ncbi:uncharacterized protein LY79DRAFT_674170 [Colletotrichum navitas]|uniref:Restriction endonuclease domain-containing protein n=1 Tax=Colletotrichum navitas TaxID=681940 RepID=A0AAD8PN56_9PEZI|nr:uncharacterized protein LY79DRAFT_674170 [Colletotrichum navitas]KAK1570218.1 hypothetical protein LY79DRAFT_674170 [Colletotrichum navitas]
MAMSKPSRVRPFLDDGIIDDCLNVAVQLSAWNLSGYDPLLLDRNSGTPYEYSIDPETFDALSQKIERDSRIDHDDLRIEYDAAGMLLRFKMPQGPVHSIMSDRIAELVTNAAINVLPAEIEGAIDGNYHPSVVAEIAYSSPRNRNELDTKCKRYLRLGRGRVRAAIAIKIPYDSEIAANVALILDQLHNCVITLWVLRHGKPQRVMNWTSLTQHDAKLTLYSADFAGDDALDPRRTPDDNNSSALDSQPPLPITVPFTDIEMKLRRAVQYASLSSATR